MAVSSAGVDMVIFFQATNECIEDRLRPEFDASFITSHVIAGRQHVTDSGTAPDETMRID
jgi:hypothetical protein